MQRLPEKLPMLYMGLNGINAMSDGRQADVNPRLASVFAGLVGWLCSVFGGMVDAYAAPY